MNQQHKQLQAVAIGRKFTVVVFILLTGIASSATAQPPFGNVSTPNQTSQGNTASNGLSSSGGAANADFDSLIDLIQSTVAFDSWTENGTGQGEMQPFPNGVFADAEGTLRFAKVASAKPMADIRTAPQSDVVAPSVRNASTLRFVSLPRLEAAIARHQARRERLPEEMLTLAGIQRVEYVALVPESRDLILAGPAGDWQVRPDGKIVNADTNQPVVRLDDLLTLWRQSLARRGQPFGCSITPRQEALAATQAFLGSSGRKPIEPSERARWLAQLRNTLGKQDVEFFGLSPDSHVARVLLVADYHMKLIGMGLAEGVDGVTSYLEMVELAPGGTAPPMSVLRWWFAMNYQPVETTDEHNLYRLCGQAVQVLSENEVLAARGERVHTGESDELNRRFAKSFTAAYGELCKQYPIYGELRNVFDLAMVVRIFEREGLVERVGWEPSLFVSKDRLRLPRLTVPTEVETVINHRVIGRRHIIAGISGGVWIDSNKALAVKVATPSDLPAPSQIVHPMAARDDEITWWWD